MSSSSLAPRDQIRRFAGNLVTPDVYSDYSATYSWVCNQTAHVGLGLLVTVIVVGIWPAALDWWPLFFIPYALKEGCWDLPNGLRFSRENEHFKPRLGELLSDVVADFLFVSTGVAMGIAGALGNRWAVIGVLVALGLEVLIFFRVFVPRKRTYDKSGLPFYYRLPTYKATFDTATDVPSVRQFLGPDEGPQGVRHLLIHGARGGGKTTLAVALAGDLTVQRRFVLYLSAAKLADRLQAREAEPSALSEPWNLGEADILVVDDLDPQNWRELLTPTLGDFGPLAAKRSVLVFSGKIAEPDGVRATLGLEPGSLHAMDSEMLGFEPRERSMVGKVLGGY
ncbi:MAG: hypothetical protein R3325_10870 [Thermoanaerobaculia bacterium]|nr:hypothetical protein [Thermoanaerobaculia bacterium]